MLPSFRLIAATFLCGFFVVFAGLRMAASLNDLHEGLPVMAAHAAPVSIAPMADNDMRRGQSAVPVMYDLRFAVTPISPTLVAVAPVTPDLPAPPLSIVPPEDVAKEAAEAPVATANEVTKETFSAIQPEAPATADEPRSAPSAPPAGDPQQP
jgi:hypothetical protein